MQQRFRNHAAGEPLAGHFRMQEGDRWLLRRNRPG